MVTIEIRNAGTAETGRLKLNKMLVATCEEAEGLALRGSNVNVNFKGDLVQRSGPLDIQIKLPDEKNESSSVEARRRLAENICEAVKRYYRECGHADRSVKTTVGPNASCQR